jgi:hypothetical protein
MKRRVLLMVVALTLAVVTAVVVSAQRRSQKPPPALAGAQYYPVLMPDLCRMRVQLQAGNRTEAYNLFYRRAHPALHALVSALKSSDPESQLLSGSLQRAKAIVEGGLISYPTTLNSDVDKLLGLTQPALQATAPTAPSTCGE